MPKIKGRPSKGSVNFQSNGLWSATVSAQNLKHFIAQVRLAFDFVQEIVQQTKAGGELHSLTCSDRSCSARLTYELQPSTSEYLLVHGWHCHPNKFGVTSNSSINCGTAADQLWRQKSFSFNDNPPRLASVGVHVEKGAVTEVFKETPLLETHRALVDGCFEVNSNSLCCQLQILHGINPDEDMRVFVMDRSAERSRSKRFFEQPWDEILHASRTESGSGAERLANEARDGVDLTGHEALVLVRSPDAKCSGSAIVGRRTAIAAVLLQLGEDKELQRALRRFADFMLDSSTLAASVNRRSGDHRLLVTGNSYRPFNTRQASAGYSGQVEFRSNGSLPNPELWDEEQAQVAQILFEAVVKKAPFMRGYRDSFVSDLARLFMLGNTATSHITLGVNMPVSLHLDGDDGAFSVILFFHGGTGIIMGGEFSLPTLGVRYIPTDLTVVIIPTRSVLHGTMPLEAEGDATRYGSSHFLKVQQINALVKLEAGYRLAGLAAAAVQKELLADIAEASALAKAQAKVKGQRRKGKPEAVKDVESQFVTKRKEYLEMGKGAVGCVPEPQEEGFTRWRELVDSRKKQERKGVRG